jgi:hypothetical protein
MFANEISPVLVSLLKLLPMVTATLCWHIMLEVDIMVKYRLTG